MVLHEGRVDTGGDWGDELEMERGTHAIARVPPAEIASRLQGTIPYVPQCAPSVTVSRKTGMKRMARE